jgi:hypothetical protein
MLKVTASTLLTSQEVNDYNQCKSFCVSLCFLIIEHLHMPTLEPVIILTVTPLVKLNTYDLKCFNMHQYITRSKRSTCEAEVKRVEDAASLQ